MRAIALALIALASLASVPASAQPYGGGWGYYEDGGRDLGPSRLRRGPRDYDRWDDGPPRSRQWCGCDIPGFACSSISSAKLPDLRDRRHFVPKTWVTLFAFVRPAGGVDAVDRDLRDGRAPSSSW
jgi:hypothetical protein